MYSRRGAFYIEWQILSHPTARVNRTILKTYHIEGTSENGVYQTYSTALFAVHSVVFENPTEGGQLYKAGRAYC